VDFVFKQHFLFGVLRFVCYKNWLRWGNYFIISAILLLRAASPDFLGLSEVKQYLPYYTAVFSLNTWECSKQNEK
jgi:hypothetical protein